MLTKLLCHAKEIFQIPMDHIFAWTDSTIVLSWLTGNPRRFKTYVGNRISYIVDQVPPERWSHVAGTENPADCASSGLFPVQLKKHNLWWKGPKWLQLAPSNWPKQSNLSITTVCEERELCHLTTVQPKQPIIAFDRFSTFNRLKRVTAWIFRFISNTRTSTCTTKGPNVPPHLTVSELIAAENYWISIAQYEYFLNEIELLKTNQAIPKDSGLPFRPFLDKTHLLRVGGRISNSKFSYSKMHPIILHGKHPVTKLIIRSEHLCLLHAGPTLLISLNQLFHIICLRNTARSITRQCMTCRHHLLKPQDQLLGQLPLERVTPSSVFEKVGIDYAGPFKIKYGHMRKPTVVKAYICLFVCLSVKAIHLKLVSDLTTKAFIAALRRFIARHGYPSLIWSDHSLNIVGAKRELKELHDFLHSQRVQGTISEFCNSKNIEWRYIPERAPRFGGLWESAVKSTKNHLASVVASLKLTFEEFSTILTQVEACLNSRPLTSMSTADDDGIEVLTPGHFLIGKPHAALPDPSFSYRSVSLLRRRHLRQNLVRHFWQRWCKEYLSIIDRCNKWRNPTRNVVVSDIVMLQESRTVPTKRPLGRVIVTHPGKDNLVRVVTVKTAQEIYKRPVSKVAVLLPND